VRGRSVLTRRRAIAAAAMAAGLPMRAAATMEPLQLAIGDARIDVHFGPGEFDAGRAPLAAWISAAAHAVAVYFGGFPVPLAVIEVRLAEGRAGVFGGVTYGETPARTKVSLGQHTSTADLADDWTMTHELTHMSFPSVPERHHWIEEGIATYVEPIARAQAGTLSVERVWGDMLHDMPKGEPEPGERGLDNTHSWASTYWGGALFCLMADVAFRKRTGNRRGLQQALRGILKAGGNIEVEWPLQRALAAADAAAGVPVMAELYARMGEAPFAPDLAALWRRLGVEKASRGVAFREDAELAAIRRAITVRQS